MTNKYPFGPVYREAVLVMARQRGAKNSKLNTLNALLGFCNAKSGQARPGNKKLMERACITKETLRLSLKWLKENGIIAPIAYANGGNGRAVVWGFGLPAYAPPPKNAGEKTQVAVINPPQNQEEPPPKIGQPPPKNGEPTERTEKNRGIKGTAGRRGALQVGDATRREELRLLSQWTDQHGFGEAQRMVDAWKSNQTVAAE
ncbi:MAG: hypothetical protein ACRBB0_15150 [Pelagimonas sp.]|uniref:hypothetical protein n=1 Tax=Pelagimonas sp. TaxID=2073170 RepID=UPI003D6BCE9A